MAIFLLKPEEIFEKYADEEAANFYEEEKKNKEDREANRGKFDDRRNDDRQDN